MDIKVSPGGKPNYSEPQQKWHDEKNGMLQTSRFAGQEMMVTSSVTELNIFELHYLGFMASGFATITEAKRQAPAFACAVLTMMAGLVNDSK
jgi:hypothetical protein